MPNLPQQTLLSSSMRQQPVPGWTTTVKDLGLPAGTVVRPVGNVGDRGIFLGITGEGWWLLGIDVTNGQRLFGPLRLGAAGEATDFNCYVNSPPNVLCVRQGPDLTTPSTGWVVDTSSGKLSFDGPTDLRVARTQDKPSLEQIGNYAIATVSNKGVYGVGSRGETTWFVPGDGELTSQFTRMARDTTPSIFAVQGSGRVTEVVFSVVDGRVVKPEVPQDVLLGHAMVYPGGFGYEYSKASDYATERVVFFDDTGRKLGEPERGGRLLARSLDFPAITSKFNNRIFTLEGRKLLELPPSGPSPYARLIGSRFYVAADADHRMWQQFDLTTGKSGKTCVGETLGAYYIGSDGEVAVALGEGTAQGVDLTTCDTLWSIPGPAPHEATELWKVNTTLVQRTDDKLFNLVAPR
ncbi:hypothetical protein ACGFK1_12335 [Mycobacterium sp. NPDC048908]|uniref:hypothetical protein n=1 Tax=Mycobacterium sp. NPDC048908 TaxID=3364292 RepID=UPI00371C09CA